MAASFVHFQVSKEALKKVFSDSKQAQYKKVIDHFLPFVLLGSVSPDYPYLASKVTGVDTILSWGDILHNKNTSDNVKIGLRMLSTDADKFSDSFFTKLAWLMGYYSHVMTDVVVHPVIYKIIHGPYTKYPIPHTIAEIHQDALLCQQMFGQEICDVPYLKELADCTELSPFTLDLDPRQEVIAGSVSELWDSILKENYPAEYQKDKPQINSWHRAFNELMPLSLKGGYIFGKEFHLDSPYLYSRTTDLFSNEKDRVFNKITLPDNTVGDYPHAVFDKAVTAVSEGWDNLLTALSDATVLASFNYSLKNWCLDDGTATRPDYYLWAGKTTDVYVA